MKLKVIALGLVASAVLASCSGGGNQGGETTPPTTGADTVAKVEQTVDPVQTEVEKTTYNVSVEESKVAWLGKKVIGDDSHNGEIKLSTGSLELAEGKLVGGEFVVDMASMTCLDLEDEAYNAKLIGHLKADDFFGVDSFPTAKLVIKSVAGDTATADLTIRDKTNEVSFPATVSVDSNGVSAEGKLVIDRSQFDVKYGSSSFFDDLKDKAIANEIELTIAVKANK
ncbi:MAG: YceI family protein [Cytophagales bacterium]|nr:YceI family protein [Cytophagales bacterium]